MFGKPLDELDIADLRAFLDQQVPEGPSLDYKRELTGDLPDTACAFANTAGGYIVVGVGEGSKEDLPDPDNVPGLDQSKKPRSAVVNRITSRTRPTVVRDVSGPIELDDGSGRVVLVIHVKESIDAPHEVMGTSPRILVRRGTKNEPIGLIDVERLISRRNAALEARGRSLPIEYFDEEMAALGEAGPPPVAAIGARPYRTPSFRFDLKAELDREIERIASEHGLGPTGGSVQPTPYGLAMEFETGIPGEGGRRFDRRVEVYENGVIRCVQSLVRSKPDVVATPQGYLTEWDIGYRLICDTFLQMMRFASRTYALKHPGVETEVRYGLRRVQGHRLELPEELRTPLAGREAKVPHSGAGLLEQSLLLRTDGGGWVIDEQNSFLPVLQTVSRWFGASIPEATLREYYGEPLPF